MSISNSILRITEYYRRHGIESTIRRFGLAMRRMLLYSRMVVFYCDLYEHEISDVKMSNGLYVERIHTLMELRTEYLHAMIESWNPTIAERNITEQFEKGALLWLVICNEQLAGYGWTMQGKTIGRYYFPLGANDVQLFDVYIFPRCRGRALHWLLTCHILSTLASAGRSRVYADTGEWNQAQLAAYTMTPFNILGMVRLYKIFGQVHTCWIASESVSMRPRCTTSRRMAMKS
jgi:hypothetical protein